MINKNKGYVAGLCFFVTVATITIKAMPDTAIKRPLITGISEVAFFTKNVKSDTEFYKDYLGLPISPVNQSLNKADTDAVLLNINSHQSIKLLHKKKPGGNRIAYFALTTNNVEAMRKYLISKGLKPTGKPLKNINGAISFSVTDPDGLLCVITQGVSPNIIPNIQPDQRIAHSMSHVGFMVADVEKTLSFYRDLLGFKEIWRGSKDGKNVT